jgi:formiminotetrahydrofolate cyclodeaminase
MDDRLTDLSLRDFVARLATSNPVPGGGSAAALAGALGAALVHMVVELTRGRPSAVGQEDALSEIALGATSAQSELLRLVEVDAAAYEAVVGARRLPRDSDRDREARRVQVEAATRDATRVPLEIARHASTVLELAERLAPIGNPNAISDVSVGARLAATAVRGAADNVLINVPFLPEDEPLRSDAPAEVERLLAALGNREASIAAAVGERMG